LSDYTASKGEVEQFSKVAGVELGPLGIRVNCVAPGAIETERIPDESENYRVSWSNITLMRGVGRCERVAALVVYLALPSVAFISGQTIGVDGGFFSQAN
jgi:3-oxoacyl-[acyl-carrier protein] reductase